MTTTPGPDEPLELVAAAFACLPDPVLVEDATGVVVAISRAWLRFVDVVEEPASLRGTPVSEVIARSFRHTQSHDVRRLASAPPLQPVRPLTFHAGEGRIWRVEADPLTVLGEVRGRAWWILDVTSAGIAAGRADETARLLDMIVQTSPDMIMTLDLAGNFEFVSPAVTHIMGYQPEDVVGRNMLDVIHPEDAATATAAFRNELAGEDDFHALSHRTRHADGYWVHLETSGEAIRGPDGEPIGMVLVSRDISERRRLLETSEASEQRFRSVVEAMEEGVILRAAPTGEIIACNKSAERILGVPSEELVGRTPATARWTSIHDDGTLLPANEHPTMVSLRTARKCSGVVMGVRRPDGTLRWISVNSAPLIRPGREKPYCAVATFTDITSRKAAEEELITSREAALEASRLKSEFLATVSHEIRTPLHGIIGMSDILLDSSLSGENREHADIVRRSAMSLLHILNDILDFSKIEAGRLDLETVEFDPAAVLEATVQLHSAKAAGKGIDLRLEVDASVPPLLRGDPVRFRQIVGNLLSNAVKFTDEGHIAVGARLVGLGEDVVTLRIEVEDTGMGVSDDSRAWLFQPFTQGDGSTTRLHGGTGLGLSICRRLVDLMGGVIDFAGTPGEGSTFWFTACFGRADAPPASGRAHLHAVPTPEPARSTDNDPEPPVVLIVEDDPINRKLAVLQLHKLGYGADTVTNGLEAIEAVKTDTYAAVLMDCQMPEMDGYSATRAVRRREAGGTGHVPIIAMTANAMAGDRENCLAAGMDDYIAKPVDLAELAEKMQFWVPLANPRTEAAAETSLAAGSEDVDAAVDSAVVERLREHLGDAAREVIGEFVDLFATNTPRKIAAIRVALDTGDKDGLVLAAHTLKSFSAQLGARRVSELAALLEDMGRDDLHAGRLETVRELEHEFQRALDEFRRIAG